MKRPVYLIIILVFLSLAGCGEQEKIFPENASVRIQKAIGEVSEILLDGRNGWVMQYFPQTNEWGGFNLYIMFNSDKTANIRLLEEVYGIPPEMHDTSGEYDVKADQSVMLTFNTENNAIHYFRLRNQGLGLQADYEFLPKVWQEGYVRLKGKKYGYYADMWALQADETADSYREKITQSRLNFEYAGYNLLANGKTYRIKMDIVQRQIAYLKGKTLVRLPYVYTPDGIKFHSPITIGETVFSELVYDGADRFISPLGDAVLEKFIPSNYSIFADALAWYFTTEEGMLSDSFREAWNKQSNSVVRPKYFYFCKDNSLNPQMTTHTVSISSGSEYVIYLKLGFTAIGDDKVKMVYKTMSGAEYAFNSGKYTAIIEAFFGKNVGGTGSPVYEGRTYTLTLDDPLNPKTLTLTADDDPGYWFKLTVYKTLVVQS